MVTGRNQVPMLITVRAMNSDLSVWNQPAARLGFGSVRQGLCRRDQMLLILEEVNNSSDGGVEVKTKSVVILLLFYKVLLIEFLNQQD